jgi:hypothetical protein
VRVVFGIGPGILRQTHGQVKPPLVQTAHFFGTSDGAVAILVMINAHKFE